MKKHLFVLVALFVSFSSFSQHVIKLFAEDVVGRRDTVIIGINDASTLGIDSAIGETNIYGTPSDSLDIRIIQRDSANFNCLKSSYSFSEAPSLYFPNNYDLKIDFRPFGEFESMNNNFEIFISATNYPIVIRGDFNGMQDSYLEGYSGIYLLNDTCNAIDSKAIASYNPINDSLFILPDSSFNTLIAHFQHEVGVNDQPFSKDFLTIYPNPVAEKLAIKITGIVFNKPLITIYNLLGQKIITEIPLHKNEIYVNGLITHGIYFLEISDNQKFLRQKFIKQYILLFVNIFLSCSCDLRLIT